MITKSGRRARPRCGACGAARARDRSSLRPAPRARARRGRSSWLADAACVVPPAAPPGWASLPGGGRGAPRPRSRRRLRGRMERRPPQGPAVTLGGHVRRREGPGRALPRPTTRARRCPPTRPGTRGSRPGCAAQAARTRQGGHSEPTSAGALRRPARPNDPSPHSRYDPLHDHRHRRNRPSGPAMTVRGLAPARDISPMGGAPGPPSPTAACGGSGTRRSLGSERTMRPGHPSQPRELVS